MREKRRLGVSAWVASSGLALIAISGAWAAGTVTYQEIGGTILNGGRDAASLKSARVLPDRPLKEAVAYLPPDAGGGVFAVCASREGRFYGPFAAGPTEVEVRTNADVVVTGWAAPQSVTKQGVEAVATSQVSVTESEARRAAAVQVAGTALEYLVAKHGGLLQVLESRKRTLAEVLELARMLKLDLKVPVRDLLTRLVEMKLITAEHRIELLGRLQQTVVFQGRDIFQDDRLVLDLFQQLSALDIFVDLSTPALIQVLGGMGIVVDVFLKEWLRQALSSLLVQRVGEQQTVGQVLTAWGLPATQIDVRELNVAAIRQALKQVVEQWAARTDITKQGLTVEVTTSGPRLVLSKGVGLSVAYPGLAIPYALTCRNVGDLAAENITIVDILPAGTEAVPVKAKSPLVESFAGRTPEGVAYVAWRIKKPMKPQGYRGAMDVTFDYAVRVSRGQWTAKAVRRL